MIPAAHNREFDPAEIADDLELSGQCLGPGVWIVENNKWVCIKEHDPAEAAIPPWKNTAVIYRWKGLRLVHSAPTMYGVRAYCYLLGQMRTSGYYSDREFAEQCAADTNGGKLVAWPSHVRMPFLPPKLALIQGGRASADETRAVSA